MTTPAEINKLRGKALIILRSSACREIRFQVDNVRIARLMYGYVGTAIAEDRVHIKMSEGNGYDHRTNTISFYSTNVEPKAIVHESTHALIDATNPGLKVTRGTHEVAAYLAEIIYALLTDGDADSDVPRANRPLIRLAREIIDFNKRNASGVFICPTSQIADLKAILANSLGTLVDVVEEQDGIGDGAPPPPKWLQGWWAVYDGNYYYYHFSDQPVVAYTETKPSTPRAGPPLMPANIGKVLITDHGLIIAWRKTGGDTTVEKFTRVGWTSEREMNGESNRYGPLFARKLS